MQEKVNNHKIQEFITYSVKEKRSNIISKYNHSIIFHQKLNITTNLWFFFFSKKYIFLNIFWKRKKPCQSHEHLKCRDCILQWPSAMGDVRTPWEGLVFSLKQYSIEPHWKETRAPTQPKALQVVSGKYKYQGWAI